MTPHDDDEVTDLELEGDCASVGLAGRKGRRDASPRLACRTAAREVGSRPGPGEKIPMARKMGRVAGPTKRRRRPALFPDFHLGLLPKGGLSLLLLLLPGGPAVRAPLHSH